MKTTNISVIAFQGNLIDSLSGKDKLIKKFINLQESQAELSTQRIGQELLTNTLPKSLFARSIVDLCDNAFREIFENIIVYLGPKFVGEKIFRNIYSKKLNKGLDGQITTTAADLLKNHSENKQLMPVKAAIAVSALAIPLAEYALSYVKNLFTLHMFKQADFNNIANLNKNKKENDVHQQKVKQSAKRHIALAGGLFAGCLGISALLLTRGKNSSLLNHFSEAILAPGSKFFKHNEKLEKFFNQYFGLDFASKNMVDKAGKVVKDAAGNPVKKLAISNGQITACVTAGFFGYTGAAKDRGKQDYKEVMYRFPLVGLYAICGNELFNRGLKHYLKKANKCKELFEAEAQNKGVMPTLDKLEEFAEKFAKQKLAKMNKTATEEELKKLTKEEFTKLFKQKTALVGIPTLFGFTVMGLFVAGCSRYFTQYRYNQDLKKGEANGKPAN